MCNVRMYKLILSFFLSFFLSSTGIPSFTFLGQKVIELREVKVSTFLLRISANKYVSNDVTIGRRLVL